VDLVVLHYISLPPRIFGSGHVIDFFMGRLDSTLHPFYGEIQVMRVSPHFFIERNGQIHQFVDTEDTAWHAGQSTFEGRENCNDFSIGIELEGDEHRPFEPEQYSALTRLCIAIMHRYPRVGPERIVGHCHVAPGRKEDPGPHFDWEGFMAALLTQGPDL
jgi:AmpD protein